MLRFLAFLFLLFTLRLSAQVPSQSSSEIFQNIKKLNVLGSVLYIAAHPDDENTLMLSYLSKDQLVRTGYLSLTRGDGGQNLIGAEQGYNIGVIRTQELLAARRIDGAQQFFSRAYDFGFSKTRDETLNFWDKEKVLGDVIWMIRKFQPDVIITRFPPDPRAGHGHHQTSAFLAEQGFSLAADPKSYPDQLKFVKPWQAKRLVWNTYTPGFTNKQPTEEKNPFISIEIGGYNPVLGKSYTEIAAESRSQHKSQGFGSAPQRGARIDYFLHKVGEPAQKSLFDGIDVSWKRVKGSEKVQTMISAAIKNYAVNKPSASVPELLKINAELNKLDSANIYVKAKKEEVKELILQCAGLWFETNPDDFSQVAGDTASVKISVVKRSDYPVKLVSLNWTGKEKDSTLNMSLEDNELNSFALAPVLPANLKVSQPYWLEKPIDKGLFQIDNQQDIGFPENRSETITKFTFEIGGQPFTFSRPWIYKSTDPAQGEIYRPFEIRPAVTTTITEPVFIFSSLEPKTVTIVVEAQRKNVKGTVKPEIPAGWKSVPASAEFDLKGKYQQQYFSFIITPPANNQEVKLKAIATVDGKVFDKSIKTIAYQHIPSQTIFPTSEAKLAKIDVKTSVKNIGYIAGAGDDVPMALRQMDCQVTMLNETGLAKDLAIYDAIVVGVRAYNTEGYLANYQSKLMDYVKNGGTMVVQYTIPGGQKVKQIGPYDIELGRERVAEEDAEMRFLLPEHPLLNYPNKITQKDFEGWIQERGLYFAQTWDKTNYQALFSANDKEETLKEGSVLYAQYGKGHYIYTGLSFFRELPAGVTGAYRLFANMISAGKK
ncbi:PIG-L family deacetylase [Dyadobacter fanqingshengii]|uniref:PIG-L family deacetylase n=1 Tax=Dyadobacter fanqingshengii TaxID=2906443 RepID=A0A9X1PCU6_9BACT|nr:PIG-L family deacetylase [Dyadobacter fanqingshengii]MCF0042626.1 PIG-L family deacetylase [Dyadobacter fanqingshengii]USJ36149.1 PIG-L family deacetylase [Dyadobacter fanqingshengii]